MTLAALFMKSVVRLQTWIKCGKSLVEHSMASLAPGITTAKNKKKLKLMIFSKMFYLMKPQLEIEIVVYVS